MSLVPFFLRHGQLEPLVSQNLAAMCVVLKAEVVKYDESKVGNKSRLKLG